MLLVSGFDAVDFNWMIKDSNASTTKIRQMIGTKIFSEFINAENGSKKQLKPNNLPEIVWIKKNVPNRFKPMKAETKSAAPAQTAIARYFFFTFSLKSNILAMAVYVRTSPYVSSFAPSSLTLFVSLAIGPSSKSVNPAKQNSLINSAVISLYHCTTVIRMQ